MARQAKKVSGVYEKYPGTGVFYVQYRLSPVGEEKQGKLIRKKIGTRQQAIDYLGKVRHIRASGDGIVPTTARQPARTMAEVKADIQGILFGDLCDGLKVHIKNTGAPEYKDQKNPPQRIDRIKKAFGHRSAASIRPSEILDWLDSELDGLAPGTKNRYKAQFSSIFAYGKERDKILVNPARDVKQKKVNNGVIRFLAPEEEGRIRKVLQDDIDKCDPIKNARALKHMKHRIFEFEVGLKTGMRKGEQYSLLRPDVYYDRREIIARDPKNGTDRIVIMIDDVVAALRGLEALGLKRKRRSKNKPNTSSVECVFGIADNKKWWGSTMRRAKVKDFRWHDLRHTFCSRLAQSGASLKIIQEAGGHKTIQMAARYAHLDQRTLRSAMEILNTPTCA